MLFCFVAPFELFPQESARIAMLVNKGLVMLDKGRFDEAVNAFEEAWELDGNDPALAENLAISYMQTGHDEAKARIFLDKSLALGGRAGFLVQHQHESNLLAVGQLTSFCQGRLRISAEDISFISLEKEHSFAASRSELQKIKENRLFGAGDGMFRIQLRHKIYNFRPRSHSGAETKLILSYLNPPFGK